MERDINNRKQGVQTHEAVLNTLQIKKLKNDYEPYLNEGIMELGLQKRNK